MSNSLIQETPFGISGNHRMSICPLYEKTALGIKTKLRLTRTLVRTVALEAVVSQDGPNVSLKIKRNHRCLLRFNSKRGDTHNDDERRESTAEGRPTTSTAYLPQREEHPQAILLAIRSERFDIPMYPRKH
jgi:hypothetical protein